MVLGLAEVMGTRDKTLVGIKILESNLFCHVDLLLSRVTILIALASRNSKT